MNKLKLSIIIPVYNVEKYLKECLDSVVSQEYSNYEIICVNDGSIDNSLQILKEYENRYSQIRVINQENQGLSQARNSGLKNATGDYVMFLDSDDWLEKGALQLLHNSISDEDFICFNGRRFFEDGTVENPDKGITEQHMTGWEYYNKYALQSRKFHFVCVVLRIYKRSFLLENNMFFEAGIYHEDNLFTPIVCFNATKIRVIPNVVYVYRIRKGSITTNKNFKNLQDIIKVANKLSACFIPKTDIDKSVVYREIAGEYFSVFMPENTKLYGKSEMKKIRKLIKWDNFKAVSIYPRHKRIYHLLKISPILFHWYLRLEKRVKNR